MKKDIQIEEVKDIAVAVVLEMDNEGVEEWAVYFLNMKNEAVDTVLINAVGSGLIAGEERHTATLRFLLSRVEAETYKKVELLLPEAFALNNQYWVSFYEGKNIFEKKYIFAANTIDKTKLVNVPLIDKPGLFVI